MSIGMNIYNVVMMSVTVVVLSSLLSDQITLSYTVVSVLIILSTTGMLLLLFLPKVSTLHHRHAASPLSTKGKHSPPPACSFSSFYQR